MWDKIASWWHRRQLRRRKTATTALKALARLNDPKAVNAILAELLNDDEQVSQAAEEAAAIAAIPASAIQEVYISALAHYTVIYREVRVRAAQKLRPLTARDAVRDAIVASLVISGTYDNEIADSTGVPRECFAQHARALLSKSGPPAPGARGAIKTLGLAGQPADIKTLLEWSTAASADVHSALLKLGASDDDIISFHRAVAREAPADAACGSAAALARARAGSNEVIAALERHPPAAWSSENLVVVLSYAIQEGKHDALLPFVDSASGSAICAVLRQVAGVLPAAELRRVLDHVSLRLRREEPPVYESVSDGWFSWQELRSGSEDYPDLEKAEELLRECLGINVSKQ